MKKAMSNVDVDAVAELRERLVGGHVGKAYQLNAETSLSQSSPPERPDWTF